MAEEQVSTLIKSLTDTVEELKRMQSENARVYEENSRLQNEMIVMLKERGEETKSSDGSSTTNPKQRGEDEANESAMNRSLSGRSRPFKCKPTRPKVEN